MRQTDQTHVERREQLAFIFDVQNRIAAEYHVERFRRKFALCHISNFKLHL